MDGGSLYQSKTHTEKQMVQSESEENQTRTEYTTSRFEVKWFDMERSATAFCQQRRDCKMRDPMRVRHGLN